MKMTFLTEDYTSQTHKGMVVMGNRWKLWAELPSSALVEEEKLGRIATRSALWPTQPLMSLC